MHRGKPRCSAALKIWLVGFRDLTLSTSLQKKTLLGVVVSEPLKSLTGHKNLSYTVQQARHPNPHLSLKIPVNKSCRRHHTDAFSSSSMALPGANQGLIKAL